MGSSLCATSRLDTCRCNKETGQVTHCGAGEFDIFVAILRGPVIEMILAQPGPEPQPSANGRAREPGKSAPHARRRSLEPYQTVRSHHARHLAWNMLFLILEIRSTPKNTPARMSLPDLAGVRPPMPNPAPDRVNTSYQGGSHDKMHHG